MDDLYTPINDMPGDSGQSASASGLTKLPIAHNTRYAKKNDIIQKYVKSTDSKYIAKSANLQKVKLPPKWADEVFGSRINTPDTGGARGGGYRYEPLEYTAAPDSKPNMTWAEIIAREKTQGERSFEQGKKAQELENQKIIEEEKAKARVEGRNEALGYGKYEPGSTFALDIKPFVSLYNWASIANQSRKSKKEIGNQEKAKIVAALKQERALGSVTDVDNAYERWLTSGELPSTWGSRPGKNPWYKPFDPVPYITPEQDMLRIKNIEEKKRTNTNLQAEAEMAGTYLPRAIAGALFRTGAAGYGGYKGGQALGLWGDEEAYQNKSNNVETSVPISVPVTTQNNQTTSSKTTPSGLKLPDINPADLDKRLKKRTGFAKNSNMRKAFGGNTGKEFIEAMQRTIDLMGDPQPVYRTAAETTWKNELRNLGIDDTITPQEFARLYGNPGWDIATIAQKNPYVPPKTRVQVGRKPKNSSTSSTGAAPLTSQNPIDNTFLRAGPLEMSWNSTPKPPVYGPQQRIRDRLRNAAAATGAAMVSTPKRAAVTSAVGTLATLGLLGGGVYGASNLYSQWSRKPNPADGDKKMPDRTLLPTMTPSAVAGTSNNSSAAPTKTIKEKKKLAEATLTARGQMHDDYKKKDMEEAYRILVKPFADAYVAEEYATLGRMNTQDNINRLNEKQQQWSDIGQSADETKEWKNRESKVREGLKNLSNPYWNGTESSWFKNTFGQSPKSRMGKRANIRKAKATYVRSQSSPYSQTAYVQPTANARFALMTPEKQGAAIVNSISENTKQNYKNTASFLNNVLSNAIKDTVNAKNFATGFARGALGAADEQTQFTNNILPQMIVAGEKAKQTSKETAGKGLQVANVGKQFVVLAVKESAKGMPEMSGKLSSKAIKNEVDKLVSESPSVVKQLYSIGKQVLNKADELQPGVKKQFINTVKNVIENTPVPTDKELGDRLKTFGAKPRTGRYDESNVAERITNPIRAYGEMLSPTKQLDFGPKFDSRVRRDDYYSTGTMKDTYTTDKNRYSQKPSKQTQSMQYLDILNRGIKPQPPTASPVSAYEQGKTTKRMSKRAHSMMFTKRLESPKKTQSQQTNNKYF